MRADRYSYIFLLKMHQEQAIHQVSVVIDIINFTTIFCVELRISNAALVVINNMKHKPALSYWSLAVYISCMGLLYNTRMSL